MMESYQDIRLEHVKSKDICHANEMEIKADDNLYIYKKTAQNLNFGAEIITELLSATETNDNNEPVKQQQQQEEATCEQHMKANAQKITFCSNITEQEDEDDDDCDDNDDDDEEQQQLNENNIVGYLFDATTADRTEQQQQLQHQQHRFQQNDEDIVTNNLQPLNIMIDDDDQNASDDKIDSSELSDDTSSESDCSEVSGLSDISGRDWKPINVQHLKWVQKQMRSGRDPRDLISLVLPNASPELTQNSNDMLWHMVSNMLSSCGANGPRRHKLNHINTFEDVLQLVQNSNKIIVLTGAGVSVSCGIPDFRSSNGIYSRLARDFPDLPDPQAMFDIKYFSRDPRPFFKFAREIYPGQFKPSPGHRFIKMLETKGKLLRNYTQNIDTLEQVAGIKRVIECHGSFSTASCTKCKFKCNADDIREDIFTQRIPVCPRCQPNKEHSIEASMNNSEQELHHLVENGIMKPDIVFFGEGLPDEFHNVMATDKDECDLLIVMGSSLKVRPVNYIPSSIPVTVPQILINRERLEHLEFDVELLGDSDVIINQLCCRLGNDWQEICYDNTILTESHELLPLANETLQQDTDTQSIKSNASTDYIVNSVGTCSDSGFESSTFSTLNPKKPNTAEMLNQILDERAAAIEKIKTDILVELNAENNADIKTVELSDLLNDGTAVATAIQDITYRHLSSIDSSKDSGIAQCETSNKSARESIEPKLPPFENFADSGGTLEEARCSSSITVTANVEATPTTVSPTYKLRDSQAPPQKRRSAAERLAPGTFYCLGNNRSYVFPGAQVFIGNNYYDDENDSDRYEHDFNLYDDDDNDADVEPVDDINVAPLSPLLTPSVEAHVVTEITKVTNTTMPALNNKRHSTVTNSSTPQTTALYRNFTAAATELSINSTAAVCSGSNSSTTNVSNTSANSNNSITECNTILCSPPPNKKRRPSLESTSLDWLPLLNEQSAPT